MRLQKYNQLMFNELTFLLPTEFVIHKQIKRLQSRIINKTLSRVTIFVVMKIIENEVLRKTDKLNHTRILKHKRR